MMDSEITQMSSLYDDLIGGPDNDSLDGTGARDRILGEEGDDTLIGGLNADLIKGGGGDDLIIGGGFAIPHIDVWIHEDMQNDAVYIERPHPSFYAETLVGGEGNDTIIGSSFQDNDENGEVDASELFLTDDNLEIQYGYHNVVWAGKGDDKVYGANGFDTLGGGQGEDVLYGFGGVDIIYGGSGHDSIYGGDGDPEFFHRLNGEDSFTLYEELYGGAGNDWIWGEGGQDRIFGGKGGDQLMGGEGNDTLSGGNGNDYLSGDAGDDVLIGGEGADSFKFTSDPGLDVIMDFDVDEDRFYMDSGDSQAFLDAIQNATETESGGLSGLIIATDTGSVFLVGLGLDDIPDIDVAVFMTG